MRGCQYLEPTNVSRYDSTSKICAATGIAEEFDTLRSHDFDVAIYESMIDKDALLATCWTTRGIVLHSTTVLSCLAMCVEAVDDSFLECMRV